MARKDADAIMITLQNDITIKRGGNKENLKVEHERNAEILLYYLVTWNPCSINNVQETTCFL